jgi:hypothetical protein
MFNTTAVTLHIWKPLVQITNLHLCPRMFSYSTWQMQQPVMIQICPKGRLSCFTSFVNTVSTLPRLSQDTCFKTWQIFAGNSPVMCPSWKPRSHNLRRRKYQSCKWYDILVEIIEECGFLEWAQRVEDEIGRAPRGGSNPLPPNSKVLT